MKHARPLLLAASTLAFCISACSQPADVQTPSLEAQFGTTEDDFGIDVAVPSADRVYVLSDEVRWPCDTSSPQRVLVSLYNSRGNLTRSTPAVTLENSDNNACNFLDGRVLQVDTQGNTYALVSRKGYSSDDRFYVIGHDIYRQDAAGRPLRAIDLGLNYWGFEERDDEHANALDMAVDGSGNIYVAYETAKHVYDTDIISRTHVVAKYSTTGTKQWQRLSTVGTPYGVTVSSSGSVYVVGTKGLARYTNDGKLTWSRAADNSQGVRSGEVVISGSNLYTRSVKSIRKYDGSGRQLWLKTQGGLNTIVVQDMTGDASGNLYLSGKYQTSSGNMSAFARKLNSSGSVLWTKTYGTPEYDDARGVTSLGGEVYVTGETQGSLAHPNRGGSDNSDGYLRKLSSSGSAIWTR